MKDSSDSMLKTTGKNVRSQLTWFFVLISGGLFAQIEFDVCIPSSWVGGGTGEITISNSSASTIDAPFTLELNWPGIIEIEPWSGFSVSGNNPIVLTITEPILPGGTIGPFGFGFSNSGSYFAPGQALLNGSETINAASPPCYIPPSYENFECERQFSPLCFHHTGTEERVGEIRIGQGTVFAWNAPLDVYIPKNRKSWAIALGVAHTMFTNLVGKDVMSINEYLATGVQETNCGCDGSITEPAWVNHPYPDHESNNPVYCFDYTHGVAVGFFQEEYGTGWLELMQDIPCFIPSFDFDSVIVGKNFEAQLIGKVYHDYNNLMFLEYIKCFEVIDFMENCKDPKGAEKLISAIYNRGMNSGFIEEILVERRVEALNADDLLDFIPGLGQQYAEQISRMTAVLDNQGQQVSQSGADMYGVEYPGIHQFQGFYDELIAWQDVSKYMDQIEEMYRGVEVDISLIKAKVKSVFDGINGGQAIGFRYDLGPVIDAIVLELPGFEPMSGLGSVYGNSGGKSCNLPTARMDSSQVICEGGEAGLLLYLTGTPPWNVEYNYNGQTYELNNVLSTPHILKVQETGLYYLTYVEDGTGAQGRVICDSVKVDSGNEDPILADKDTTFCFKELNQFVYTPEFPHSLDLASANWKHKDGLELIVEEPGTYQLDWETVSGCEYSSDFRVREKCDCAMYLPNVFSPYSVDGANDEFGPIGTFVENYELQIYNRWGELVFDGHSPWDGRYEGEVVFNGVYIWKLKADCSDDSQSVFRMGHVVVLGK